MASNRSKNIFATTYKDDFRDSDHYHRILFNGGRALQARELTQLQTIIQKEVERFGRNIFKDGAAVDPVSNVFVSFVDYVKIASGTLPSVGDTITGDTSGVEAVVREVIAASGSDLATLLVDYTDTESGTAGSSPVTFTAGENLNSGSLTIATSGNTPFGRATKGHTGEGVFFVQGHFVYTRPQEVIISKYSAVPTDDLGFLVTENIITENDDTDLYDNQGDVPNLSAPGAHRYQINLTLTTRSQVDSDQNFVYTAKIVDGKVVEVNNGRRDYNKILDVLAQRTFEESGNYTVNPFIANFEEGDSDAVLDLIVEPGIAYVNGYRAQPLPSRIEVQKPTTTYTFEEQRTSATYGNFLITDGNSKGSINTNIFEQVDLKADSDFGGATIGTARVRAVCPCGTGTYRHYLFDIQMNSGQNFQNVLSLGVDSVNYANVESTPAVLQDAQNNDLFFGLPYDRPSLTDTMLLDMFVQRRFTSSVGVGGQVTLNLSGSEFFTNQNEWIVTVDSSAPLSFTTSNPTTQQTTITVDTSYVGGTMDVHAIVEKDNVPARSKTLTNVSSDFFIESDGLGTAFLNLGKADIYRVNTAEDSAGNSVLQNYYLDNGQRDNYYGLGRLVLLPTSSAPNPGNGITVDFDYFAHGGTGGFFNATSYNGEVSYAEIPSHRLSNGDVIQLRNVLDFRPRISDTGLSFDSASGVINELPKNTTLMTGDMTFYLPRRDRLVVQQTGEIEYLEGTPSFNPEYPSIPVTAMNLYDIQMNANSLGPRDTKLNFVENKRYTMRDIGRLERKIEENRELITLSLLELETSTLEVLDGNNNNRTKSGFFVDNFRNHRAQDHISDEFLASNDMEAGELRPAFKEKHITPSVDSDNCTNVVRKKNALLLSYQDELYIDQTQASDIINVNPFNVVNNVGFIELTPDKDDWIEETIDQTVIDRAAEFINGTTGRTGRGLTAGTGFGETLANSWTASPAWLIRTFQRIDPNWRQWDWGWWGRNAGVANGTIIGQARAERFATEFFDINNISYSGGFVQNSTGQNIDTVNKIVYELARMGVAVTGEQSERTRQQVTIPFIRSREVAFAAYNLKPLTRHFAYFDNLDMTNWVRNLTTESNYNTLVENIRTNPEYRVISGENRTEHPDGSSNLVSDASGTIYGSFFIPSNSTTRINTGTKRFALYDINTPIPSEASSSAFAEYTATGLEERVTENIQETVELIRFDPIAQTIFNDKEHSIFVTKVGVYVGTKDDVRDLTCEIRPVVNGYPSGTQRLKHAVATIPQSDITTSSDASVRTDFVFERPIELKSQTEYAIVLLSQSDGYNVWVATMGNFKVGSTTEKITSQPSLGSLFKSQNGSTWEPSQNQDLTFQLFIADFSTSTLSGEAAFNVPDVPKKRLPTNPFLTTAGSNVVRVTHPLHGMNVGDKVNLSIWGGDSDSASAGGLLYGALAGERTITAYDASGYLFNADSVATFSTIGGSYQWEATENAQIDALYSGFDILRPEGTITSAKVKLTSGKSYAGNETAYVLDTSYTDIAINENNYFDGRKMIANSLLRTENMSGGETVDLRVALSSSNKYVSPVIDYMNTSLHCIANIIDNQDSAATSGYNVPLTYIDETEPSGGSSIAKYVGKTVSLANEGVGLKVIVSANVPSTCSFDVYYKTAAIDENIANNNWVLATVDDLLPTDDNPDIFREYRYTIGGLTGTLDPFLQFKVKIVMRTTDNTQVPRFRDLRVIALAV